MKKIMLIAAALAAVNAFAITATKEYVDNATNATLTASKSYTDTAVAGAVPGNYETVSNRAMNAVLSETDPTVPSWAKAESAPVPGEYETVSNKAKNAVQKTGQASQDISGDIKISGSLSVGDRSTVYPQTIGANSFVNGYQLAARGAYSHAEGSTTYANGYASHSEGIFTAAEGYGSHSDGMCSRSVHDYSYTWGGIQTGRERRTYYCSNGNGTYNISPQGGTSGFYIGSQSLATILGGYVPTTRTINGQPLTNDIVIASGVTSVNNKTGDVTLSASDVGAATTGYVDQQNAATRAIVATWENFLDGSNVVFSITNYISGTYNLDAAKLRIMEMTNGVYREVYNSREEILLHINDFKNTDFAAATNQVIQGVSAAIADKADKAWGKYTSAGGDAPSNTVYMTAPQTVFAGGMEYERVAVGEGSVCILTTKGAPTYTQGDEGTFKFQDDGGTNYFGFAKTDSYVIGADASGISVQNHIVTINYDVTMSGVPCIWYKADLTSNVAWEQLNLPDGTPVAGASHVVSWEATPPAGKEICYINCPEAKGFFKATIEVAGSAKFMTNMPADLSGGIFCTDGQHKVKINWNNGAPTIVPAN